ncbi:DUF1553 domain-containing protein [Acidobacteria bacterium AB60]|nr:DUF1553 domain-containing protein [Acidobacteria bacterium AB60]
MSAYSKPRLSMDHQKKQGRLLIVSVTLFLAVLAGCHRPTATSRRDIDFNQEVQPILAARCFACHGPDPEMRKAGLRLDLAEYAMKKRPGHPDAIVPGHPEKSELIKRIESHDAHYLMPETSQGEAKPLDPGEITVLREWVRQGAKYRPHWAFEAPIRPAVPIAARTAWPRNPIDNFILAQLDKAGLQPSPEADKATLIRRVTLDLTGLLPTPEEVRAFVHDSTPNAYEHLVDTLLSRPAYGEQRARYWLDYARYADTYGLHYDNSRHIWPYRDYVIRAFNSNKPFDQFAREQIAGDLLPAKDLDPLIGSGYVRLGESSNEGGTIPEELRFNIARDRTEAYGATFLGLTVGCAVCHDHKFDPTTAKDFYSLSAFFNNIEERPFNGDRPVWTPVVRIPRAQNRAAYDRVYARRAELQMRLRSMRMHKRELVTAWLTSHKRPPQPVSPDKLLIRLRLDEGKGDVLHNSAPHGEPAAFKATTVTPQWGETTWLWPDFRMQSNTRVVLDQSGDFEQEDAFSAGGWFMFRSAPYFAIDDEPGAIIAKMDTAQHDRGWDLTVRKGIITVELVNSSPKNIEGRKLADPQEVFQYPSPQNLTKQELAAYKPPKKKGEEKKNKKKEAKPNKIVPPPDPTPLVAIRVSTVKPVPTDGQWRHIFFTYNGSGRASGIRIFIDGSPVATQVETDTLNGKTIRTTAPMQLGWRSPAANPAKELRYQDIRLYGRCLAAEEARRLLFEDYVAQIAATPASQWTEDQWQVIGEYYLNYVDASFAATQSQMYALDTQLDQLSSGGDVTQVAWEKRTLAYAHVLERGNYAARAERVGANTPHYLPPLPADMPHNRLSLAEWTVSPENPLTARVTVNRMWNELFGTGIVETTEDFGIMGQRPSNPELLDWLAVEFRESGWNIKHMYKLMVMSAAYRQSAASTPDQLEKDPRNLLLSHGPRFRMDAEMLRDIALQSGGLLVNRIGGPSVKPYQPPNVWEQVSYPTSDTITYVQGNGEALYRRSIYTYWKRMASPPNMDAFDAPVRDAVCTRRQRTDTPLQALVTMDDVQWVEAARALAQRVIQEAGPKPRARIERMSEILLAHMPSSRMEGVLASSAAEMESHYNADPKSAHALVHQGESEPAASIPERDLATWTMVANEMLNLDETLNK